MPLEVQCIDEDLHILCPHQGPVEHVGQQVARIVVQQLLGALLFFLRLGPHPAGGGRRLPMEQQRGHLILHKDLCLTERIISNWLCLATRK